MKNIFKSLSLIVAVAALVVGGTIAYFSDTEVSENNVFTAGTIDIAVNDQNPWSQDREYTFGTGTADDPYLEPSDSRDIDVTLSNVGTNDVVIWKKVL
jgi:predicted ribosomally synthesized peptide with SipW-like signal peptide